ncbi:MAG TPA: magnesium transporter CorA family protein [Solirubrobacteraceae bacterium]|nr:magnesium transporter CorA family protein [Solirubrobacteraceae bacterium]
MHILDRVDPEQVRAFHARGEFFWLDLDTPSGAELETLAELIGLPRLAVDDTIEFDQRAKVDDYGDRLLIVFHGTEGELGAIRRFEVHMHLSARELVTVHHGPCPPLQAARDAHVHTDHEIVYRTLDALSESTLATLRRAEDAVVALEQRAFERPTAEDRRRITRWRGELFRLVQVVVAERDMLEGNAQAIERVLGMEAGAARHPIADVRDDLVQAANLIAYCREVLGEALNVHLQMTSNRLNEIATRLTVLATIVIPLTLITGFFGQNFGWLVDHIDSLATFLVFGVGGMVLPAAAIWAWLRRAGYLNSDGQ